MNHTITLKDISAMAGERLLFKHIDLSVGNREKIAIIGNNGIGKTTLLEIIAGLKEPNSGEIKLFGKHISNLKDYKIYRKDIGYLFQNSDDQFICPNVLDDVSFSLLANGVDRNLAYEMTKNILNEFGIWHLKDEIVFHLSGGEKKLVAIAGVLIYNPKIILLDEPTSGLDIKVQEKVAKLLSNLDVAQIIVSHNENFINKVVDKIFYLTKDGLENIN
ncbi:cobalt ABC transporter ATP-binding protein [Helicobacter sp. 16-1353]|uniref:energy-coupling factor ABC transporter ATP-binding protein n=1 Tax=Helicobacter sp. 16-1353 TaxID=2004996 RepID=UPI000DCE27AA|nr:ABC transporter ATP-binding protein [Helicobacter sp. 16-1353]RAX54987.1 cobalt ABC transporter ATP-binding protein [Helicobacter sp. 16-1353]